MMRKAYKDRMLPEAFKKQMEKKKAQKKGQKREDPKGNPGGYYDSNKKKKADMGRKGPYADGMGKKCTCDAVAEEFNAVLDTEAREDKPCGNSYIPEAAKCSKGRGTAKASKESLKNRAVAKEREVNKGRNVRPTAEQAARQAQSKFSDMEKKKAIRKAALERFKGVKTEKLKASLKANKGNKSLEGRTVQKAAKRELFNRGAKTALQSAVLGYGPGLYLESRRNKNRS